MTKSPSSYFSIYIHKSLFICYISTKSNHTEKEWGYRQNKKNYDNTLIIKK